LSDLTPEGIAHGLTYYVVLLFSLSFHESAHAWMAWKLGDDTAKNLGRVTLNPIPHIDPIGTVLFPLLQIFGGALLLGWAKPTPYNPANFRRDVTMRKGHMLVAAAGPVSNLLLGLFFAVALILLYRAGAIQTDRDFVFTILVMGIGLNVMLAVFNFIPIPPLDGSKVASFGLPGDLGDRYDQVVGPYGFLILILLLVSGAFSYIARPIQQVVFAVISGLMG
jgi:Zn-dependent protease